MVVFIAALILWWVIGWKFAALFAFGALVQSLGHVCVPQRDRSIQTHVRSVLEEDRKRQGFVRY